MISDLFIGLGCENVKVSSVFLLFIELWSLFVDLRFVYWVVISGKFSTDQNNGFVHDIHIWMSCHVVLLGFVGLIMISGFVGMWHVRVSCRLYLGSQLPGWRKDAWMKWSEVKKGCPHPIHQIHEIKMKKQIIITKKTESN